MLSRPLLCASVLLLVGCGDDPVPVGPTPATEYRASIRRTSYGIPHVTAATLPDAAFGLAYAGAQDFVCILADQIVKVRAERSVTFGEGAKANLGSDLAYRALGMTARAEALLAAQSETMRDVLIAYVAGYNHYLAVTGNENLPSPCQGAAWARPITTTDLAAYYVDLNLRGSAAPFLSYIINARPPLPEAQQGEPLDPDLVLPDLSRSDLGSNGWAIGSERSAGGRGMLVANPHFPWEGELRFWESHITVPGVINVYGASLTGLPVINVGFNEHVAWTHTVTPARHFTVYKLPLVPGDPTSYLVDGVAQKMTSEEVVVEVKQDDGSITTETRTFWKSHHGAMVAGPGLEWNEQFAFTFRDANAQNDGLAEQWLQMNMATSLADFKRSHEEVHGIPWVYTIATDKEGNALLLDSSRVPNLSAETQQRYRDALENDALTGLLASNGAMLLDGSDSSNDWVVAADGSEVVPVAEAPQLERKDFAANANDPAWLSNPAAPIEAYSVAYGRTRAPISARTRMNLLLLTEENGASGDDQRFTLEELQAAIFSHRGSTAERLLDEVLERCAGAGVIDGGSGPVDVAPACTVLGTWDRRLDAESVGALVWRELLAEYTNADVTDAGPLYAVPFDPDAPLTTPNTLMPAPLDAEDPLLLALARAIVRLESGAGFSVTTPLGEAQFTKKGEASIPIPGGNSQEGTASIAAFGSSNSTLLPRMERGEVLNNKSQLTPDGYPVNYGNSIVMTVEFTDAGPRAAAILTYSESTDPASPHYKDQTERYPTNAFRPVLFTEAEIEADPGKTVTEVSAAR